MLTGTVSELNETNFVLGKGGARIYFQVGLWLFSFVADVVARGDGPWPAIAFYTMAGGLVGALLAAIPDLSTS